MLYVMPDDWDYVDEEDRRLRFFNLVAFLDEDDAILLWEYFYETLTLEEMGTLRGRCETTMLNRMTKVVIKLRYAYESRFIGPIINKMQLKPRKR